MQAEIGAMAALKTKKYCLSGALTLCGNFAALFRSNSKPRNAHGKCKLVTIAVSFCCWTAPSLPLVCGAAVQTR